MRGAGRKTRSGDTNRHQHQLSMEKRSREPCPRRRRCRAGGEWKTDQLMVDGLLHTHTQAAQQELNFR